MQKLQLGCVCYVLCVGASERVQYITGLEILNNLHKWVNYKLS